MKKQSPAQGGATDTIPDCNLTCMTATFVDFSPMQKQSGYATEVRSSDTICQPSKPEAVQHTSVDGLQFIGADDARIIDPFT